MLLGANQGSIVSLPGATLADGLPVTLAAGQSDNLLTNDADNSTSLHLNPIGAAVLTGLRRARAGRIMILANVAPTGGVNITLSANNAASIAQNRFNFSADLILTPGAIAILYCTNPAAGWQLGATSISSGGGGGSGTVTSLSVPNDFVVTNPTTTPAIAHGAILAGAPAAGATNDYNPGSLVGVDRLELTPAGVANLTGLTAGQDGQPIILTNLSASNLTLNNQNAGSAAANRFRASGDMVLTQNNALQIVYYGGGVNRWVLVP